MAKTKTLYLIKMHLAFELWYNARTGNYYVRDWNKNGRIVARCGQTMDKANHFAYKNCFEWKDPVD